MANFIIIGGGARGLLFTEILEKQLGHKVVAIVDTYVKGNEFIKRRLEAAHIDGIGIFNALEPALKDFPADKVDGAFIITPEWTHRDIFVRLIAGGYNIFLEKPVATTLEDAQEIYSLAMGYPKTVQIGFVLRYSSFFRKVKEIIDSQTLGKVIMVQMNERLTVDHGLKFKRSWHSQVKYTGGFLNEKCCHDLDLMNWFLEKQAQPVSVFSLGSRAFATESVGETFCETCPRKDCIYRDIPQTYGKFVDGEVFLDQTASGVGRCVYGNESDIMDNQSVLIKFSDNSHGVYTAIAMSGRPGRDLMIHCEYGLLVGELEKGTIEVQDYRRHSTEIFEFTGMDGHGGADTQVVSEFVNCVTQGSQPMAHVRDGVLATIMALSADESVRRQVPISIPSLK